MRKNERGSVTIIVAVTVMFVFMVLSACLMFVSTKRKAQLQESQILQNVYGGNVEEIYAERTKKQSAIGYISNGLLVSYDGINNTGDGHSNDTTTWKNLAGNSTLDGQVNGATFHDDYLSFDGQDDWVAIGDLSGKKTYTLDLTVMFLDNNYNNVNSILCNVDNGGISFFENSSHLYFETLTDSNNGSKTVQTKESIQPNKIYNFTGTYDGNLSKLYVNGVLNDEAEINGQFKDPENNTIFVLGTNPSGNDVPSPTSTTSQYKKMNVYSCRLYDRAISDAEVKHNYEIDQSRYNIE